MAQQAVQLSVAGVNGDAQALTDALRAAVQRAASEGAVLAVVVVPPSGERTATSNATSPDRRCAACLAHIQATTTGDGRLRLEIDAGRRGRAQRMIALSGAGRVDATTVAAAVAIVETAVRTLADGQSLATPTARQTHASRASASPAPVAQVPPNTTDGQRQAPAQGARRASGAAAGVGAGPEARVTHGRLAASASHADQAEQVGGPQPRSARDQAPEASKPPERTALAARIPPSTDTALGYAAQRFDGSVMFHGLALSLRHRRPVGNQALAVELAGFAPFETTVERSQFDAVLSVYVARLLVGLEYALSRVVSLAWMAGLFVQSLQARAQAPAFGVQPFTASRRNALGGVLRADLRVRLFGPAFLTISLGADLDPTRVEHGLTTEEGRFQLLYSLQQARPFVALRAGAQW